MLKSTNSELIFGTMFVYMLQQVIEKNSHERRWRALLIDLFRILVFAPGLESRFPHRDLRQYEVVV